MPYQVPGHMVSKCFWIDVGKGNKHIRSSRTGANQPPEIYYLGGLISPCTRGTNMFVAFSYIYPKAFTYHVPWYLVWH